MLRSAIQDVLSFDQNLPKILKLEIHSSKLLKLIIINALFKEHFDPHDGPGDPEDRQPLRREVRHLHGPELPQRPRVVLRNEHRHQRRGHHEGEKFGDNQNVSFLDLRFDQMNVPCIVLILIKDSP